MPLLLEFTRTICPRALARIIDKSIAVQAPEIVKHTAHSRTRCIEKLTKVNNSKWEFLLTPLNQTRLNQLSQLDWNTLLQCNLRIFRFAGLSVLPLCLPVDQLVFVLSAKTNATFWKSLKSSLIKCREQEALLRLQTSVIFKWKLLEMYLTSYCPLMILIFFSMRCSRIL